MNQFLGKLIGGLLGLLALGFVGLILGLWIGHAFDRGFSRFQHFASPEMRAKLQDNFFSTTFHLLGYLAKADGRISEVEIKHTESLISQMQLNHSMRQRAITFFKAGADSGFSVEPVINEFLGLAGRHPQLKQTLFLFLVTLALADGEMDAAEQRALDRIGHLLGFRATQIAQLLRMAQAQGQFHQAPGSQGSITRVEVAYEALGVEASATDAEIKRAYRKLMSANHPDKLIAKGVPDAMIRLATEKSQEIQSAYEVIKKHRA
jgi:DnaJ like chaperone protein